ncbi:NUMOD4 domain-containing protein [Oceanobacillus sp. FSL H7-0719]|uniref:NUMOD4 domain-containing protein n=1 Tax=Oceanobacillus sp. FSL H7-0719 TaxID=2954507 RepID=UPI0032486241
MNKGKIWKDIKGYEGLYQVSKWGRVKSLKRKNLAGTYMKERMFDVYPNNQGYYMVKLSKEGKGRDVSVHRLVAETFIPNPDNKPQVNHIDGNPMNNKVTNLEWVTPQENIDHAWDTGLNKNRGEAHSNAKLNEEKVKEIRSLHRLDIYSVKELSEKFKVSIGAIYNVISYRTWKHIK